MSRAALLCVLLAACAPPAEPPRLDAATPPHGPLVGGTHVTLTGSGFAGGRNRVLVGGREAPLVSTVDDATLDLLLPPGDEPGPAELVVVTERGTAGAAELFRYSAPPTITAVSPRGVFHASADTTVTVTGTGFLDEDAGDVAVAIDGQLAADVTVLSDTTLTFTAPSGRALVEPDLELVDRRGRAVASRAFRYTPGVRPGLLLFPPFGVFAIFFDPVDRTSLLIPRVATGGIRFTTIVRDARGDYWAADRSRRFGRVDFRTQRVDGPVPTFATLPAMARVGTTLYGLDRNTQRFGTLDPATGVFTPIGDHLVPCCGSYGLAADATTAYVTARDSTSIVTTLTPFDLATGTPGTPVPLSPTFLHIEELRLFGGTLYATTRDGSLVTIDPTTGQTTVIATLGRAIAMEVFE